MRHLQLLAPLSRIRPRRDPIMVFAEEPSQEFTERGMRRPQQAKVSRALGLSGLGHRRKRKHMQREAASHVNIVERSPRGSRSQTVGFATISQPSIAEVAARGFRSADIVVTEPHIPQVVAKGVALDRQITVPRAVQEVRPVTRQQGGAVTLSCPVWRQPQEVPVHTTQGVHITHHKLIEPTDVPQLVAAAAAAQQPQ